MGAFASEEGNLRASISELAPTLEIANAAFASLNAAFPPTRAWAIEILPGVRETAATIDAAFPWVEQVSALMGQPELGGLLDDLTPATRDLAAGDRRVAGPAPADRSALQVRARQPAADRERGDPRRVPDRPRELQGLLLRARRARGRGPEPRRQRRSTCASRPAAAPSSSRSPPATRASRRSSARCRRRRSATGPRCRAASRPFDGSKPCYKQTRPDLNGPAARKTAPINAGGSTTAVKDTRAAARGLPGDREGRRMTAIRKHAARRRGDHRADRHRLRGGVGDPRQPAARAAGLGAVPRARTSPRSRPSSRAPRP